MAQNGSGAIEAHDHGDVDWVSPWRWSPAAAQSRKHAGDGVDLRALRSSAGGAKQEHRGSYQEPVAAARHRTSYLTSEATCTFTILSGSVTAPPGEPGGAFFSLSTTSMPCTTSPTTV